MSLKNFHLLFITSAILLMLFFSAWSFGIGVSHSESHPVLGGITLVLVPFLCVYGIRFWKKMREIQ